MESFSTGDSVYGLVLAYLGSAVNAWTWIKPPAFAASADLYSFRGHFEIVTYHVQHD